METARLERHRLRGRTPDPARFDLAVVIAAVFLPLLLLGAKGSGCQSKGGVQAPENRAAAIQGKIEEVQRLVPEWVAAGGDPGPIQSRMRGVQARIASGRLPEAEAELDEVLSLLRAGPGARGTKAEDVPSSPSTEALIGKARPVRVRKLPADADIVFRREGHLYAMDERGDAVTRITLGESYEYEHVASSPDRTKLVANRWGKGKRGRPRSSTVWVIDLERETEAELLPSFVTAGEGGVDWGRDGFIFLSARETDEERQFIYKIRYDGTGLTRLTSDGLGFVDVGLSADGGMMAYCRAVPRVVGGETVPLHEVWAQSVTDGKAVRVFDGGPVEKEFLGTHLGGADPTPSPDHKRVVFSKENRNFRNFPGVAGVNTAHDLFIVDVDGTGIRRITPEGPISIIPDWQGRRIVYTEISEADGYHGISVIDEDGSGKRRLGPGEAGKWIPRR